MIAHFDKRCFKCGLVKSSLEFYRHPQMADGFLGKCKSCTKLDVMVHRDSNLEAVRRYDRERSSLPHRRADRVARFKRKALEEPLKYSARVAVSNAVRDGRLLRVPCEVCGAVNSEAHHEDYSKPLEVVWLCKLHHEIAHHPRMAALAA